MQSVDRNSAILLDGYIEVHKQVCNKEDCPLKVKGQQNQRLNKAFQVVNQEALNEKYSKLYQLIYKFYFYGIKKFPSNTNLRLSYAFFLLEKMQYKQQSL